jgi:ribosomal protein S18 acetylase RimI-like enzyme
VTRAADPVVVEAIDAFAELDTVTEIYATALELPLRSDVVRRWRDETLPVHATRLDYRFLAARAADGTLLGTVYGYTGAYGQWWTDQVAAAMDVETRAAWLDPPHYEVVELHVRPRHQRRGIGSALLDELLARQSHERALLTADPSRPQPLPFYRKHGWQPLAEVRFTAGGVPRVVLGKWLPRER